MSRLANWLARRIWWSMLWFMRRRSVRRLQKGPMMLIPEARRAEFRRRILNQDKFARRYGLITLTVALNLCLASLALTASFLLALQLLDSGKLSLPDEYKEQIAAKAGR